MIQGCALSRALISSFIWTCTVTWKEKEFNNKDRLHWDNFLSFGWNFTFPAVKIPIQGKPMYLIDTVLGYWILKNMMLSSM